MVCILTQWSVVLRASDDEKVQKTRRHTCIKPSENDNRPSCNETAGRPHEQPHTSRQQGQKPRFCNTSVHISMHLPCHVCGTVLVSTTTSNRAASLRVTPPPRPLRNISPVRPWIPSQSRHLPTVNGDSSSAGNALTNMHFYNSVRLWS